MDKELLEQIDNAIIPKMLKDYFLRNHHVHLYINRSLLKNIEESYIEYDSLYEFDDAEFCAAVITGIKKQDKHDYFYHYLKKVLDNSLTLISKSTDFNLQKLIKLEKNLSNLPESRILVTLNNLHTAMQDFKSSKEKGKLYRSYMLVGELQILLTLYPDNEYDEEFNNTLTSLIMTSK